MKPRAKKIQEPFTGNVSLAITGWQLISEVFPQLQKPVLSLIDSCLTKEVVEVWKKQQSEALAARKREEAKAAEPKQPIAMTKEEYMEIHSRAWDNADEDGLEYLKSCANLCRRIFISEQAKEAGQEVQS
jgi:hypothetical protein